MSFSFNVTGANKAEARAAAVAAFANVVEAQPAHSHDEAAVLAAIDGHLALIPEPNKSEKVVLGCHGSVSWQDVQSADPGTDPARVFMSASVGVNVSIVPAE